MREATTAEKIKIYAGEISINFAKWEKWNKERQGVSLLYAPTAAMNRIRERIEWYKQQLVLLCEPQELPSEYFLPTPPVVDPWGRMPDVDFAQGEMF